MTDKNLEVNISLLHGRGESFGSLSIHITRIANEHNDDEPGTHVETEPSARGEVRSKEFGVSEARARDTDVRALPCHEKATEPTNAGAGMEKTWIFQASPQFSDVRNAVRSLKEHTWLVQQFKQQIAPGNKVYLWECGPCGGIIGLARVSERPRIQPEPVEQLPFIRNKEKFSGDRLRVRLTLLQVIDPVIPRKYLLSRAELTTLSILRCPRATNFNVTSEQAKVLQEVVERMVGDNPVDGSGAR